VESLPGPQVILRAQECRAGRVMLRAVPWLLARLLAASLDRTKVRGGEALQIIFGVARNPIGMDIVLPFILKNVDHPKFQELPLSSIMVHGISRIDDEHSLKQVDSFFQSKRPNNRSVKQMIELIRANVRWRERNERGICQWLTDRGFGDDMPCL